MITEFGRIKLFITLKRCSEKTAFFHSTTIMKKQTKYKYISFLSWTYSFHI